MKTSISKQLLKESEEVSRAVFLPWQDITHDELSKLITASKLVIELAKRKVN